MTRSVEFLSPVDTAWLSMEEPTNQMVVNAVITFDQPLELDRVLKVLEYRWLRFSRFGRRVVRPFLPLLRPYWEDDPNFSLEQHVSRLALPAPGDSAALQAMVSDLISLPLDFSRPPWKFYLIENYGEGSAVLARIHHCLADGMAQVAVLLAMTDLDPDAPLVPAEPADSPAAGGLLTELAREAAGSVDRMRRSADRAFNEVRGLIEEPSRGRELGEHGLGYGLAATRLLARSADPRTQFKGKLGVLKKAAWSRPIPLSDVKLVKNNLGGTINDVLVSVLAGGLRRYLVANADSSAGAADIPEFRAAVPVNLRNESDNGKLGNKFGLVFLTLPVSIEDPLMRLVEVRRRMDELKRSAEAPVTLGVLGMMGVGTDAFREMVIRLLEPKATVVLTNVPGPPVPLYLAGQQIREIMFWVPQAGRLGVGLSILSYAGQIYLGVATDAGLVADPEAIIDGVLAELDRLKAIAEAVRSTA